MKITIAGDDVRKGELKILHVPIGTLMIGIGKTGYDPGQLRVPAGEDGGGEWTDEDQPASANNDHASLYTEAAGSWFATPEIKQQFVDAHLKAAQDAANALGVPVENVLGLAALESQWGYSRFALEGNTLFNLYSGAALKNGSMKALGSNNRLATFPDTATSFRSFAIDSKRIVSGVSDPTEFASKLQAAGKYGIDIKSGLPVAGFVGGAAATMKGLRSYIARRSL
jgi:hypothetical protein